MYVDPNASTVYQGDIIQGFVFSALNQPHEIDTFDPSDLDTFVANPRLTFGCAMVVSNSCDITRRPFVSVVRIFPLQTFVDAHRQNGKSEQNILGEIAQLKSQKIFYYYYIPADSGRGVEEGYADLTFINPLDSKQLPKMKRIASLDPRQIHVLSYKLGNLFMRPH